MSRYNGDRKRRVLLNFPVRHLFDANNGSPMGTFGRPRRLWKYRLRSNSFPQIFLNLALPNQDVKWVRHALYYELTAGRHLRSGHALGRSQIKFSKKKPWAQKGTGRARSGSKSSPLWKGGGVVFGPNHSRFLKIKTLNKKIWKTAVEAILYNKRGNILFIQGPWHSVRSSFSCCLNALSRLGLTSPATGLVLLPNHICVDSLRDLFPDNLTLASFSTLKCLDLLLADFVIVLI